MVSRSKEQLKVADLLVINNKKERKSYLSIKIIAKSESYLQSIARMNDERVPPPRTNTEISNSPFDSEVNTMHDEMTTDFIPGLAITKA